jgi:hypothetical protein
MYLIRGCAYWKKLDQHGILKCICPEKDNGKLTDNDRVFKELD